MEVSFKELLGGFNELFTLLCVFPTMLFLGLYLTIRLRFVQISKFKLSLTHLMSKKHGCEGSMSHFEAMSAVLASNFGTGNVSGMAVALTTGGPGALVWMWVMAFLGAAIQYASCLLGVKYRTRDPNNEYVGGPMYYLSKGLGFKKLASLFCLLTITGAITTGVMTQVNSMSLPLIKLGMPPFLCGTLIAVFVGYITLGGLKRTTKFASFVVPLKAFLYLGTAWVILFLNYEKILPAFGVMFDAAFNTQALMGGVLGGGIVKAITTGFDRGIFATDAGNGIVPLLQSGARTTDPVVDGLVTLVAPFLVMIVCTTTGLVLIITDAWQGIGLHSTNMVTQAFTDGLGTSIGAYIVIVSLLLFGYTTVVTWSCCLEKAVTYLWGHKIAGYAKYAFILLIPFGALADVEIVWALADVSLTAMLVVNMIGVAGLSKEVIEDSRVYFDKERKSLEVAREQV